MTTIPIGVTARNEARNILILLDSLRTAIARAESQLDCRYELHVVLNDNRDHTADLLANCPGIQVWHTYGGLVEAQRALAQAHPAAPFIVFSDADIRVGREALLEVSRVLLTEPAVEVAYAGKYPIRPRRSTPLAKALYLYNLREGYQTARHYFNGQFFAIRHWSIPTVSEVTFDKSADNRFLNLAAGIRIDDIYLSRTLLSRYGPDAIRCVPAGIEYRPPETLQGMFRKYQRMVLEIERLHHFFPETKPAHNRWGRRRTDLSKLAQAPLDEKIHYAIFRSALSLCKIGYRAQKLYFKYFSRGPCPTWAPVTETKEPVA